MVQDLGGYRLIEELGSGGMGVVYLGVDGGNNPVAVKVLHPHIAGDETARKRLAREVRTLRRIRHPRIAEVLDAELDSAQPFIITEFVDGQTLSDDVRENGPFAEDELVHFGHALLDALGAVHDSGVIHRDLKPANVMIMDGEPMVIDFGIAQVADEVRVTATGLVMGTPGYLSPEIADGRSSSEKTDWWGWAATMAFAATGRNPYGSGPLEAVLGRVAMGKFDLEGTPPGFVPLLSACLDPKPERRPSGQMILDALVDIESGRIPQLGSGPASHGGVARTAVITAVDDSAAGRGALRGGHPGAAAIAGAGALGGVAGAAGAAAGYPSGAGYPSAAGYGSSDGYAQPHASEAPGQYAAGGYGQVAGRAGSGQRAANPLPQGRTGPGVPGQPGSAQPFAQPLAPGPGTARAFESGRDRPTTHGGPGGYGTGGGYGSSGAHGGPGGYGAPGPVMRQAAGAGAPAPDAAIRSAPGQAPGSAPGSGSGSAPGTAGAGVDRGGRGYGPPGTAVAGRSGSEAGAPGPGPWPGRAGEQPELRPTPQWEPLTYRRIRTGGWVVFALIIFAIVIMPLNPLVISACAFAWSVLARTATRLDLKLQRYRYERGDEGSAFRAIAMAPAAFFASVLTAVATIVLPVVAGVAMLVLTRLDIARIVPGELSEQWSVWAGAAAASLVLWIGPGASSLRRGSRLVVSGVTRNGMGRLIALGVIAVLTVLAAMVIVSGAAMSWWPLPQSPFAWLPGPV